MSVTRRLIILSLIAIVGLAVAALSLGRLRSESDAAREKRSFAQADATTTELLTAQARLSPSEAESLRRNQVIPDSLHRLAVAIVDPLFDASAGFCLPDGSLIVLRTVAPVSFTPSPHSPSGTPFVTAGQRHPFFPLDRDVVRSACLRQRGRALDHTRFVAPHDLLFVTVQGAQDGLSAWTLLRIPNRLRDPENRRWLPLLLLMFLMMAALVLISLDTVISLRRGSDALSHALRALERDLRAQIPKPRVLELLRLAEGLSTLTAHLWEAQERERQLAAKLDHEKRLAALGRVVAGVAHEVRNPLTGLKLRLDLMARRKLDDKSATDVKRALTEVSRLDRVVGSLLLLSKRAPTTLEQVSLASLVDDRMDLLSALATSRQIRLLREGDAVLYCEPLAMSGVIDNLLRNALEASPMHREVRVQIGQSEQTVTLRVSDHGSGVPKERESELFEPFFSCKPDGTGLGLCLARAAVESHQGRIGYERHDHITSFVVELPQRFPERSSDERTSTPAPDR